MSDPRDEGASPPDSLLAAGARGFAWLGGGQAIAVALHLVIRLILARMLAPQEFGLVAAAAAFTGAGTLLLDFGMGAAMVQRNRLSDVQKSSAFWLTAGVAIITMSLLFVGAPLVGRFYHTAAVVPIVRALSVSVVFAAFEAFFAALLSRRFQFRTLGMSRIVAILFAGLIGIACATQGMGAWALVTFSLVNVGLSCLLLVWKAGWLPAFDFSWPGVRDLWSFARPVVATRVVNYVGGSVDKLLVGRYLGPGALGLYSFSYQAVLVPLNFFSRPMGAVSFPILSSVQSDLARCGRACKDGMALVVFVAWPCAAIVALSAPIAVPSIVGDRWVETVSVIQVLSCVGAIGAALNIILQALLAVGKPVIVFRLRLSTVAASVAGFALGLRWGIEGVALGFLTATIVTAVFYVFTAAKLFGHSLHGILSPLWRGAALCCLLVGTWIGADGLIGPVETLVGVVMISSAALAVYIMVARTVMPETWAFLVRAVSSLT